MTAIEWLKIGEQFLTPEQIDSVRQMVRSNLARQREVALARAAAFEAEARALDGTGNDGPHADAPDGVTSSGNSAGPPIGANGAHPDPATAPATTTAAHGLVRTQNFKSMTIADVAVAILNQYPDGLGSAELVQKIAQAKGTGRSSIYGSLTNLEAAGAIRKRGNRTAAVFYPKEARSM
jgi:hypothetical protein